MCFAGSTVMKGFQLFPSTAAQIWKKHFYEYEEGMALPFC
jgi:hypothetical protein